MKVIESFRKLSIERKLLARRLFRAFFVATVVMAMVANMARYSGSKDSNPSTLVRWSCCILQLQFTVLFGLLLSRTPSQGIATTVTFLTCISLAVVECFIASMSLRMDGAFAVRIVGYVLVSHMELIASTCYREWSLFSLFVSIGVEFVAWLILIPLHHTMEEKNSFITHILYGIISVSLSIAVWLFVTHIPLLSTRLYLDPSPSTSDNPSFHGFRYDDALYSVSTGNTQVMDSTRRSAFDSVISVMDAIDDSNSSLTEDAEILDLRFQDLADLKVHRVCIILHVAVMIVAFLAGQNVIGSLTCDVIFGVLINPTIALWQVRREGGFLASVKAGAVVEIHSIYIICVCIAHYYALNRCPPYCPIFVCV